MADRTDDISELCERALQLSKIQRGEKVCLLTTHVADERILDGFRVALGRLGADAIRLILPPRTDGTDWINPIQLDSYAHRALKQASMVIRVNTLRAVADVSMYTQVVRDVLFAGVRWLDVNGDEMTMRRLFPTDALIARTLEGSRRLAQAETLRITSDAGTDLTVRKRGRKGHAQVGYVDEPGRWDNFGFGLVACAPEEDQTEGVVVFDVGDSLGLFLGPYYNLLYQPVRFHFERGRIVRIEGGQVAAAYDAYLKKLNRPEHYRIAHIGWGTHEKANWGGPHFTVGDWESYYGNVMIHLGHNVFDTPVANSGLGGQNHPSADWPMPPHSGGVVLNHSLWLDGQQILDRGRIVAAGLA
jgi:2,5-dihydroxypyridine 5,6-dioxygenase